MKNCYLFLFLFSSILSAQTEITLDELPDFIDKKVKVCDKVYGTYVTKSDPPVTLINVGGNYPDHPLTLAIFGKDLEKFSYVPSEYLVNKHICATGKLILYKGKPEIILNSEKDLEIRED